MCKSTLSKCKHCHLRKQRCCCCLYLKRHCRDILARQRYQTCTAPACSLLIGTHSHAEVAKKTAQLVLPAHCSRGTNQVKSLSKSFEKQSCCELAPSGMAVMPSAAAAVANFHTRSQMIRRWRRPSMLVHTLRHNIGHLLSQYLKVSACEGWSRWLPVVDDVIAYSQMAANSYHLPVGNCCHDTDQTMLETIRLIRSLLTSFVLHWALLVLGHFSTMRNSLRNLLPLAWWQLALDFHFSSRLLGEGSAPRSECVVQSPKGRNL